MPKSLHHLILFLFCFIPFILSAQTAEDSVEYNKVSINKGYITSYWKDTRDVALSPFKPSKRRLIGWGTAIVGTSIFLTLDNDIKKFAQENRTENSAWVSENLLEPWGSGMYSIPLMAGTYGCGLIWKNDRAKRVSMLSAKSFVVASLFARLPKYAFRRIRPNRADDAHNWFQKFSDNAFVSGHTTAVFAFASMYAIEYKETVWVPILAYTVATLSGISRIHDNKHWASDVFAGAMLGYGVSSLIYNANNWNINLTPVAYQNGGGVGIVYDF